MICAGISEHSNATQDIIERTTSTPRFRATAMTVFSVPKSTPTTEEVIVSERRKADDGRLTYHSFSRLVGVRRFDYSFSLRAKFTAVVVSVFGERWIGCCWGHVRSCK